jgi:DNA-binding NarL/FixJ family response regulator
MPPLSPTAIRSSAIAVLVVDDDPLLCSLITHCLTGDPELRVIGTARNRTAFFEALNKERPDLITLDLNLGSDSALDLLTKLMEQPEPPKVLVLSGQEDEETQVSVGRLGAQGFLAKSNAIKELAAAIKAVAGGDAWFSRRVLARILREHQELYQRVQADNGPLSQLSGREREVMIAAARGLTNSQIASELFLSPHTVKLHMKNLMRKLNLSSRTEAAVLAVREGLLDETPNGASS